MEYTLIDDIALLRFDDGKANAISYEFMAGMGEGLDRAAQEAKAVVLTGRPGLLSGGFDLKEMAKGAAAAKALATQGAHMMLRLFSLSQPLLIACPGHAIAAGAFLLLTADNRIGASGDFNLGLNETAIGATFPVFGIELARARLNPAYSTRALVQSELFTPDEAVTAGYLDQVVAPGMVEDTAMAKAASLAALPAATYAKNKLDLRQPAIQAIRASLTD